MSIGVIGNGERVMESNLPLSGHLTIRVKHGTGDVNVDWDHKQD
jgi:hypothetical protein